MSNTTIDVTSADYVAAWTTEARERGYSVPNGGPGTCECISCTQVSEAVNPKFAAPDLSAFYAAEDTTEAERAIAFASVLAERDELASKLVSAEAAAEAANGARVSLQEVNNALDSNRQQLRADLATVRASLTNADSEVTRLSLANEQLTAENQRLRTENPSQAEIEQLRGELRVSRLTVQNHRERHEADIRLIGEYLLECAEREDWCHKFDEAIEYLNGRLNVDLPERVRERDYVVSVTVTMRVTATDEDGAGDLAEEALRYANRNGNYSFDYQIDEVEQLDD